MKDTPAVVYKNDTIIIKALPPKGEDIQVFVRPTDTIEFPYDISDASYQIVGGDVLLKLPDGGTITFVSMGLLAFQENSVAIRFPSAQLTLDDILSQVDEVKEAPVESVITDEFVALNEEFSTEQAAKTAEPNDNFSKILEEPSPLAKDFKKFDHSEDNVKKPVEEFEENDFNAIYRPADDNPANVNFSSVENAVEAGLKFTLTAYQTAKQEIFSGTEIVRVDGGGGSEYGAQVDTPEAQFQPEVLDYSDASNAMTIYADSPKLFKVDPTDPDSASQLARDLSIKPEQPIGFGISSISISNLPSGFEIVGATYSDGVWDVPEAVYDENGNLVSDGFTVDINTGKARFTMTYPDDLPDGEEVTAVINFTSTFDTANLLPGESADTPDITTLEGQGRLQFVTKTIDWDSPTGFEGFIDDDGRVVLATNPNNNIIQTSHGDTTLIGGDGRDIVTAYEGNDTISGAKGDDTLDGGAGDDTIFGDDGDDVLQGKSGTNTLDGGYGEDTVDYSYIDDIGGVDVDLSENSGTNSALGVFDTIFNVEKIVGSAFADRISGDDLDNILLGEDGKDTLYGAGGNDILDGGANEDILFGESGDDTLLGGSQADTLDGGIGDDTLLGELGDDTLMWDSGNDTLDGGLGADMVDFSNYDAELIASINDGFVTVTGATDTDTIFNMEIIRGSSFNDTIDGGLEDNTLYGNSGDDIINGHDGSDILHGDAGDDTLLGGKGLDVLEGNDGDDLLRGEEGADQLDGGNGTDTADYSYEGAISTVLNLGNYVAVNVSGGDNDLIRNVENILGSNTGGDTITGDALVNILSGQGGNDTLDGGAADDTLFGGSDDDVLRGGSGDDLLDGGGETSVGDTADYTNQDRIIVTMEMSGADTSVEVGLTGEQDTLRSIENITGSDDSTVGDTITGNEVDNILKGLKGDDTLSGEQGDDYLDGGFGNDTLIGGDDQDTLRGSYGDDYLEGGRGVDILEGGDGIDVVSYQNATNRVDVRLDIGTATGDGTDTIYDVENVIGSAYDDTIIGNESVNTLFGGSGDDTILGGTGNDTLYGEEGSDTLSGDEGEDYLYGGDGTTDDSASDMASYKNVSSGVGITVDLTNENTNSSTAVVSNDGYNSVDYLFDIENIEGTNFQDFIQGDEKDNYLLGEAGDDTLYGGAGTDTLDGGFGDDIFRAEAGNDTLIGGDGVDTADYSTAENEVVVNLGEYNLAGYNVENDGDGGEDRLVGVENIIGTNSINGDTIIGDITNNYIQGLDGDDLLKGSAGLDTLDGGAGNDTLMGGTDSDTLIGGIGDHDIVDFSELSNNGVVVDLADSFATGDGNDVLQGIEDIRGSDFVDTLGGDDNTNTLYAGVGDDTLSGRAGDDVLYGEAGDDTLRGDAGADSLYGGDALGNDSGSDTADYATVVNVTNSGITADLSLSTEQVSEDGYGFSDTLYGIENVSGTIYDDMIKGSDDTSEVNILSGNSGDDSFVFSDGKDSIRGGVGSDTIDYSSLTNTQEQGLELDFDVLGVQKTITKTTESATYEDLVEDIEHVIGTDYKDTFIGGSGTDTFEGGSGNDIFFGNSEADTLIGDAGDDTLDGGDDDDVLEGGIGDDTLIGGRGDDIIDGGTNAGDRDVADYTSAASKISLDLVNNQVVGADTGTDTLTNVELILATNYEDTLVGDNAKNVLDGRASNDTIVGQDGDDTLIGYTGSDTINGGLGSDLLIGGSDTNDIDTVGFNELSISGTNVSDINSVVTVDLENQSAHIISVSRTDVTETLTYSFDITDASGTTKTISYTAQDGDTGDDVIAALNSAVLSAGLTDIKVLDDTSNTPNIDVYETSHRLLFMDTSAEQSGFEITNIDNLIDITAGTALSLNTLTGTSEIDYLFDFDNIKGSDVSGSNVGDTLTGDSQNNNIYAGEGDDTIFSTAGTDYLDGEGDTKSSTNPSGGDWIDYSNQSAIRVDMTLDIGNGDGTGSDNFNNTLKNIENVRGTDAVVGDTIVGDENNNILEGGDNNNHLNNGYNRDTLNGAGGDDTLYGQAGQDVLYGGTGNDTLYGGTENDILHGGTGTDQYDGGEGYDVVDYLNSLILLDMQNMSRTNAEGDDSSTIFTSIEEIYGSNSSDEIRVTGSTNIYARDGDDILVGGSDATRILGVEGNDLIDGGAGDDLLYGGRGNDTFFASTGRDIINGGDYTDTIDFRDSRTYTGLDGTTQNIGQNVTEGIYVDFRLTEDLNGDGVLDYGKIENNGFGEVSYIAAVENLEGTTFDDTFVGDSTTNVVHLYDGDDRVFLSDGGDTIDGGTNSALSSGGGDWVDASNMSNGGSIYLLFGTEYMGSLGGTITNFEHIKASEYNDYMLQGNGEDNTILGMAGDDTLVGLQGNDYLDGGADNDTVSYSSLAGDYASSSIVVHFDTLTKNVTDGYGDTDTLVSIETVIGSQYDDVFYGSDTNDTFLSGGGQDSFVASEGDDFFSGNESGVAASIVDYSSVLSDNKLILDLAAESDNAQVVSSADDSKYFTDQLRNIKNVIATDEDDTLAGSSADNSLYGLDGDDTFIATDGNDTYDGGDDINGDWVDYSSATVRIKSNLDLGSTSKGINGSTDGLNSIEHIITGSGNDVITASDTSNTIIANAGSDTIYSNAGDNVFYADDATDTSTNAGIYDSIKYDLEDTGTGVKVNISSVDAFGIAANSALNAYGGTDTLYNFEFISGSANGDTLVGSSAYNSINGGAGNDTIYGDLGNDTLLGAAGDDTILFKNSEFGSDLFVSGGDDFDTLAFLDQAAVSDTDFENIDTSEKLLFLSDAAHSITLGENANITGITEIDATAALSSNVSVDVSAMTNDMRIQTGNGDDDLILGAGTDIVNTYDGNDVLEYDAAAKVDNALGSASDTLDGGAGIDTLYTNAAEDFDFTAATLSSIESVKFYQGDSDQKITFTSDQNLLMDSFSGNASQINTVAIETTATQADVDMSSQILADIDKTYIHTNFNIDAILTGNNNTQDEIIGSEARDTISGLGGNDTLSGNGGDDTFLDGSGIDTIFAGSGDDKVEFTTTNLDATDGNDTIDGGEGSDTLAILDAVTTTNLTDALLSNVFNFETIALTDESNSVSLNQDGVKLLGGSESDTFTYDALNFSESDTLDGGEGVDSLIFSTAAAKTLADFANLSNVEHLVGSDSDDTIDLTTGSNGFDTIALGAGDDTLTIDGNNVWIGKTLDGGDGSETSGDTLDVIGNVDLSQTTVINFENISSDSNIAMTVKLVNDLDGNIDVGTNTLSIVGNDGDTVMSAANIVAGKITFTSGMESPTTVNDIHMDIDASASNFALDMSINAQTAKTSLTIQGSSDNSDVLNVSLANSENIDSTFGVDSAVESFNVTLNDSDHTLDLSSVFTTLNLQSASATDARTITVNNATKDINGEDLSSNESLYVNAIASSNTIIGGASSSDTVVLTSGSTYGSISSVEIINVEDDNDLSTKINNDVTNINIAAGKTLLLASSDLDENTLTIDNGVTSFTAGMTGANNYTGVTLTSGAELVMQVSSNLDIASQGSDDISVVTEVDIDGGVTFKLNADQTDNDLDVKGATSTSSLIIQSTSNDANNVFSGITKNPANAGSITYNVVNNVDKSGEAVDVLGDIDTLDITSGATLKVDTVHLSNITTLNGDATLDIVGDGNVDLSALNGTFSGDVLISDVSASETIIASKFNDTVTIDAGSGDTVITGEGDDTVNISQNIDTLDGGDGTDTLVIKASGLDLSTSTISNLEEIVFDTGGNAELTMLSTDVNTITISGDTNTNTLLLADTGTIDLSTADLSSIESLVFNDSGTNIITANLDGVNLLLGDSGDTLKINATDLSAADTITGGSATDTIAFSNGGTIDDSAFSNVVNVENLSFADSATNVTLGNNAGTLETITGGAGNDSVTLTDGGSYTSISAVETLNVDRTIDLSGKITDVSTINVLTNGEVTLDATDFTASILVNNDNLATINNATTSTMNNLDLSGSTGITNLTTLAGDDVDFSNVVFDGTVNIKGTSAADETIRLDEGVASVDGIGGTNVLEIKAGSTDSFSETSIANIQTLQINETVDLSGTFDSSVTEIDVKSGETLTISSSDIDSDSIDFGGVGTTHIDANGVTTLDFSGISNSGGGSLNLYVSSTTDISTESSDTLDVLTDMTLASGVTFTLLASQTDNTLNVDGAGSSSDLILVSTATLSENDFSSLTNSGNGNVIYNVENSLDFTASSVDIFGSIDTINIDSGVTLKVSSNQIGNITTLDGSGVFEVLSVDGNTDLSGIVNGAFSGTINIITDDTQADTIIGSAFDENIVYQADAQSDIINGGNGTDTIVVQANADLEAINGSDVTNVESFVVDGDYTATLDKDFVENASITSYTGGATLNDIVKVSLADGESIDMNIFTMSGLDYLAIDVAGGGSNATLRGNSGVDNVISVVDGANIIETFNQDDTITGGSGNDTITIGDGNDTVSAGDGDDIIRVNPTALTSSDTLDGGTGDNTIELTSGTSGINDTSFTNVSNIQTLKTADADTSVDFSTDAGSISIVDASTMTSTTSNLNIITGAQLTEITGGAGADSITYSDANLSSADILNGGGGIDTLYISDAANISADDLSNITNIEVLQLSDNDNTVDLTNSSIATIIGGTEADTLTAQGDEETITTGLGDDEVSISSVPTGLIDGGSQTLQDTLYVNGDLDLSSADILNFEEIVTSNSITLNAAQANNLTMAIASGQTLTIKGNGGVSSTNLANITGGNGIVLSALTAALTLAALSTDLDASSVTQDVTVQTADGSLSISGSTDTTAQTDLEYTATTTLSGTLSDIDTITVDSGVILTSQASTISGQTVTGDGVLSISDASTTLDLSNTSVDVILEADTTLGSGKFGSGSIEVLSGVTLTADAADVSGKTITGEGTLVVNNLDAATNADFSNLESSLTVNVEWSGTDTYTGNLDNVDTLSISSGTMNVAGEIISAKTIDGSGTLNLLAGNSTIDLVNVSDVTLTADIDGGNATLNNLGIDIDATNSDSNLTINANENANVITGGSGDDTINGGTGGDVLNGGAGDDTFVFAVGDEVGDSIDGGTSLNGDTIVVQGTGSFDFTSALTSVEKIDMSDVSDQTLKIDAETAASDLTEISGNSSGVDIVKMDVATDIDLSNITTLSGIDHMEYNITTGSDVVATSISDQFTIDFSQLGNAKTLDGVVDAEADSVSLVGSVDLSTSNATIADSEFANITTLDITSLTLDNGGTNDLSISTDNLDAWMESGETTLTLDIVDDTQGQDVSYTNGTTTIDNVQVGQDYTIDSLTLHVV